MDSKGSEDHGLELGSGSTADPIERLLFKCLERIEAEGERAAEPFIAEHPEHAAILRTELEKLRSVGLLGAHPLGASAHGDAEVFPERLGEFRLLERLGGGGMGVVFAAEQESLGRKVALKLVRPEQLYFPGSVERFRREVETVARLNHPGIVPVYAVGRAGGIPYFAMELIEGCTLAEVLQSMQGRAPEKSSGQDLLAAIERCTRSVTAERASVESTVRARGSSGEEPDLARASWVESCVRIARQVAEALDHAHDRGVVHRDVKPSNIAITRSGRAMLLDFGLAQRGGVSRVTRTGAQLGSLPYMSPEQARGEKAIDRRSDVYSLGVALYELLTLRSPFEADTTEVALRRIVEGDKPPPRRWNRAVPRDVEMVCLTAMERDPGRRYASAGDLARDLSNVLSLRPIEARPQGLVLRARRWSQRKPAMSAALAFVVLGLLILAGWSAWGRYADSRRVAELLAGARELFAHGQLEEALEKTGAALAVRAEDLAAHDLRQALLQASRENAQRSLAEITRLTDWKRLRDLAAEADRLWPAMPERIGDLSSWRDRERALYANLDMHRESLRELRKRSSTYAAWIGGARSPGASESFSREEEQTFLDRDAGWDFADETDAWHAGALAELVLGLAALPALARAIEQRLSFASTVEERTVTGDGARAGWAEAIADIAASPVYRGLMIRPQLGLLPLWRNPQSRLWEFLHVQSGDAPVLDRESGRLAIAKETGIVLVLIPGGSFAMGSYAISEQHPLGSPNADPEHRANEEPVHAVELAPFFLSKYEMTQGQWLAFTGANPSVFQILGSDGHTSDLTNPVENVSWEDCVDVLGEMQLRLPSEAQWEYACRAGTTSVYSTGDDVSTLAGHANIADSSYVADEAHKPQPLPRGRNFQEAFSDGYPYHSSVATFLPNPWGLHDMHGNVWEWCLDAGDADVASYRLRPRAGDGLRLTMESRIRSSRGGSFEHAAVLARSACRSENLASARRPVQGVRPAREVDR